MSVLTMIEVLTATHCLGCMALKASLEHAKIPYKETRLVDLSQAELNRIEEYIKFKLIELRCRGQAAKFEDYMSAPMVRAGDAMLFPPDLINGGVVRVEALEAIRRML